MGYRKEASWQVVLSNYLRESKFYGYFELKVTNTESFAFSKIEAHQYTGLQATENEGLVWKLSDQDMREKPCDTLSLPPLPSYVVIKFIDAFYFIRMQKIVDMRETGSFGISHDQAKELAEKILYV